MFNSAKTQQFISLLLVAILALGMLLAMRPLPSVAPSVEASPKVMPDAVRIPWPNYGQASVGAEGYGVLGSHGQQKPVPMASITKLVTALVVLQKKSLKSGETGPAIELSEKDVAFYSNYLARGGSIVPVATGQRISQYQAMQAMLIPSANNMADSLAIWAYDSIENYVKQANLYLKSIGLNSISVADASGFSAKSVATSDDLVKLGIIAIKHPVISGIVSRSQVDIPLAGVIYSTNRLLGTDGIVGIKTGNTDEAGGCYLFAAKHQIDKEEILIVGVVLGAPAFNISLTDSQRILAATKNGFKKSIPVAKNQIIATYKTPWGTETHAVAKDDIEIITWQSRSPKIMTKINKLKAPRAFGTSVGTVKAVSDAQSIRTEVILKENLPPPSPAWRVFH